MSWISPIGGATQSVIINAPAGSVWSVIGGDFANVSKWAAFVHESRPFDGRCACGEATAGRVCTTARGDFHQHLVAFDDGEHHLGYEMHGDALPPLVRRSSNDWRVQRLDDMSCEFSMTARVELLPLIGTVLRSPMEARLRRQLRLSAEELKHYVETGRPHDRKIEFLRAR